MSEERDPGMDPLAGPGEAPPPELPVAPPARLGVPAPRPGLLPHHAGVGFGLALALTFVLSIPLAFFMGTVVGALGVFLVTGAALLAASVGTAMVAGEPARGLLAGRPLCARGFTGSAVLALAALTLSITLLARLYFWFGAEDYVQSFGELIEQVRGTLGSFGLLVLIGLVAPFFEELLFRGVIQRALRRRWAATPSVFLAAALFGIFHFHPVHAVIAGLIGLAAGYAMEWTGSFWAAYVVHAVNNLVAGWLSFAFPDLDYLPAAYAIAAIPLLALSLWLLLRTREIGPGETESTDGHGELA